MPSTTGRVRVGGATMAMTRREVLGAAIGALGLAACGASGGKRLSTRTDGEAATVDMEVIHATPVVAVEAAGPNSTAMVPAWLDTGGGWSFVSSRVASRLHLRRVGSRTVDDGQQTELVRLEAAAIGSHRLDLSPTPTAIARADMFDRTGAEAFLPAKILATSDVVFDYPHRQLTIGPPGTLRPTATAIDSEISEASKFLRIEVAVAGQRYGMLLDTGASHTMVSNALFDHWRETHPEWPVTGAALGTANMAASAVDRGQRMMRIPEVRIGDVEIHGFSVVTRPTGTFERSMSSMMSSPIAGALAGNVLEHLRVEIAYGRQRIHLGPDRVVIPVSYVAPIVLGLSAAGVRVVEVLPSAGVDPAAVGAVIVGVDGATAASTFAGVAEQLRSDRPATRTVTIERDGARRDLELSLVEV